MHKFNRLVQIQAVQFNGFNYFECMRFMGKQKLLSYDENREREQPVVDTPEGDVTMKKGDYIINDPDVEGFQVVSQQDFESSHNPA